MVQPGGWKVIIVFDVETTSLSPLSGRVISIGYWLENQKEPKVIMAMDEKALLKQFFDMLEKQSDPILCGYNSNNFDIMFLRLRALKHHLSFAILDKAGKLDLMNVLTQLTPGEGFKNFKKSRRLKDWCEFFGIECGSDHSGFLMNEMWEKKLYSEIEKHQLEDVKRTRALYDILKSCSVV